MTFFYTCFVHLKPFKQELAKLLDCKIMSIFLKHTVLGRDTGQTLTYKSHIKQTAAKVQARNNLLSRLVGTKWGLASLSFEYQPWHFAYAPAEYCTPIWSRSTHTKKLDGMLNNSMCLTSGCIRSTPTE